METPYYRSSPVLLGGMSGLMLYHVCSPFSKVKSADCCGPAGFSLHPDTHLPSAEALLTGYTKPKYSSTITGLLHRRHVSFTSLEQGLLPTASSVRFSDSLCDRTRQWKSLHIFTLMSHGDGLLAGYIVVDDHGGGIVWSCPQDFLSEGTVPSLQQSDPLLGVGRDLETRPRVTAQAICNWRSWMHIQTNGNLLQQAREKKMMLNLWLCTRKLLPSG